LHNTPFPDGRLLCLRGVARFFDDKFQDFFFRPTSVAELIEGRTHVGLKISGLHWLEYCFELNELQKSTTHFTVLCSVRLLQQKE